MPSLHAHVEMFPTFALKAEADDYSCLSWCILMLICHNTASLARIDQPFLHAVAASHGQADQMRVVAKRL